MVKPAVVMILMLLLAYSLLFLPDTQFYVITKRKWFSMGALDLFFLIHLPDFSSGRLYN